MMAELLRVAPRDGGDVFRQSDDGAGWIATGELTFANAGPALAAARALPLPASGVIDCAGIARADSAAIAVLLALKRRAAASGAALTFAAAPALVNTLAELYDVEGILDA
jgi:phospholipid transport system transporter-binding protein